MATIQDIQALGYTVGIAHGSVQVEQEALAAAKAAADPNVVAAQVNTLTTDTVKTLDALGKLPDTPEEKLALVSEIAAAALDMLTTAVTEKVAFHERALQIATESPDVWCVQQFAGEQMIVQTYVSCKLDGTGWDDGAQAHLDALADAPSYAERDYQAQNPDAMSAMQTLASLGRVCTRPTLGADTFTVDGTTVSGADLAKLAVQAASEATPAELAAIPAAMAAENLAASFTTTDEVAAVSEQLHATAKAGIANFKTDIAGWAKLTDAQKLSHVEGLMQSMVGVLQHLTGDYS